MFDENFKKNQDDKSLDSEFISEITKHYGIIPGLDYSNPRIKSYFEKTSPGIKEIFPNLNYILKCSTDELTTQMRSKKRPNGSPVLDIDLKKIGMETVQKEVFSAESFFYRVKGDSMTGARIFPEDILICNSSIPASHKDIVVANVNGSLFVKRLLLDNEYCVLRSENHAYEDIVITEDMSLRIIAVVIGSINMNIK